ncbi:MAG: asparaginase [Proteobacteria bacterium]|nr:asparaginase [Pseudomonadota bacterium]
MQKVVQDVVQEVVQQGRLKVVILGTGGTIAGTAAQAGDTIGYTAGQVGVAALVAAVPMLAGEALESEQVAQLDSKDMTHAVWLALAQRVEAHLARPEVAGVVITHGTDTLEETAYFLHRVVDASRKPVVLCAAMRPATALSADGPQNLLDAVQLARTEGAAGVMAVLAGSVHAAADVRKVHPYRADAFSSGDAGVVAHIEAGRVRRHRPWPEAAGSGSRRLRADPELWPRVEIVTSHAGARGTLVAALQAAGVDGIVVAATGNGSLHHELEAALVAAQQAGVRVLRSTRCLDGAVLDAGTEVLSSAGALTPVKARIALLLDLMTGG